MLTELYSPGTSLLHRAPAWLKILILALLCTLLFIVDNWLMLGGGVLMLVFGYGYARISPQTVWLAIRPVLWFVFVLLLAQLYLAGFSVALFVLLRLLVMILAASLLTLTTKASEMIEGLESLLVFLPQHWAKKTSLAVSLSLRSIPMVRQMFTEVREAQRARGLGNSWRALLVPTVVRTLKSADDISQAIIARSGDSYTNKKIKAIPQAERSDRNW